MSNLDKFLDYVITHGKYRLLYWLLIKQKDGIISLEEQIYNCHECVMSDTNDGIHYRCTLLNKFVPNFKRCKYGCYR